MRKALPPTVRKALPFLRRKRRSAVDTRAQSVASAVLKFALTGTAALALLGFGAVALLQHTGRDQAIRDATRETVLASRLLGPAVTGALIAGQPAALARMDRLAHQAVLQDPVVRVKIWNSQGRILYSDKRGLIGSRYTLGPDEMHALRSGGADAEVSDLSKPENRFERSYGKLLEVYLGIRGPGGQRLLFEDYLTYSSVAESGQRLWLAFAPALIGTLVVLELAQIPLAWSLARRIRRGQAEREALLRRSLEASDMERRRIARDLHDGAVQNLAGVSYSLSAAAEAIDRGDTASGADTVRRAATETRHSIRELRTLLVDIYPPNLGRAGLAAALSDLVSSISGSGLKTDLDVPEDLEVSDQALPVLYRVAQEALRNVVRHADAQQVRIAASRMDGTAALTVEDDGRGFEVGPAAGTDRRRHFGLRILHDLASDSGGELHIESSPGQGTRIRIEVPA